MKIQPKQIAIRELVRDFNDSGDAGVVGFGGRLNIRPAYQREFVYKDEQRNRVIDTLHKGYPLNVMYWARNPDLSAPLDDALANYEVLDGQQRTLSICKYVNGDFSVKKVGIPQYFHSLPSDEQEEILDYELTVYICDGLESEKLEWFRTINIAGEKLTDQELLNAVYTGSWLSSAKTYFSKPKCAAHLMGSDYVTGSPIRQELLELALNWLSKGAPADYMAVHQHDKSATELWAYFTSVITWVKATFPTVRSKEMRSVDWGALYDKHHADKLDPVALEKRIAELLLDEEVTIKAGVYPYVLNGKERHLSLRAFPDKVKLEAYTKQAGGCAAAACPERTRIFDLKEMEADHIDPWHAGGRSVLSNCRMLCKACNRRKGGI